MDEIAARFPGLKSLSLNVTDVTDAGLPSLLALQDLEELQLISTRVTEESYETLCSLPSLARIQIGALSWNANYGREADNSRTTRRYFKSEDQPFQSDTSMMSFSRELFEPNALRVLQTRQRLLNSQVLTFEYRSRNYFAIGPMESLHVDALKIPAHVTAIDFTDTYLDDAGLQHVCEFPQLEVIKLHNTWVTDAGLRHLKKLKNLRSIDLAETRTTAACAEILVQIPSLESIRLPASADGNCAERLLGLPCLRYLSVYRMSLRRPWLAHQMTMEDLQKYGRLADVLFDRADANSDGVITESDFERLVTFGRVDMLSDDRVELRDSEDLLKVMLYQSLATPEVRVKLRN